MSLSVGIVGLPNVGKSTLFNALLKKQQALAANYPFATIEPNTGIVPVPDERLQKLAEVIALSRVHTEGMGNKETLTYTKLPPLVPATVMFVDIAGIVKGASEGEGLGNKFLSHIREADVICMVVRAFEDVDVVMTGSGEPGEDKEVLMTELILADLQTIDKQQAPKGNITPEMKKKWEVILKVREALNNGRRADMALDGGEEREAIRDLCLMTVKPVIYVVNVDEKTLGDRGQGTGNRFGELLKVSGEDVVVISAKIEADLADLNEVEQKEYLESMGIEKPGLEQLITAAYKKLGLQSYLTAGEKECRAWTIKSGSTAVEAAGVIHTDFMKKFIKAEIASFEDFVSLGGWKKAREMGKARMEGRDYIMKDGDVVDFKIGQ